MGEGLDSYALIGVVAAGWHPGEVFSISVIPKDGTAKSGWILLYVQYCIRYKLYSRITRILELQFALLLV